jgi:hypothetical protein
LGKKRHNNTYLKRGVSSSKDNPIAIKIVIKENFVLLIKFCGKSPVIWATAEC